MTRGPAPDGPGPVDFDLLAPLPHGHLALEASAGTGKTYALAALATRFLAERNITTSDLLIVTFTRAATSELRASPELGRVRQVHAIGRGGAIVGRATYACTASGWALVAGETYCRGR